MSTLKQEDNFIAQFAKGDSTEIDEVAAIDYFVKHFEENEKPPVCFNHGLIDVFLRVLSDPSSDYRVKAANVIANLIDWNDGALMHAILDKNTLDHLVCCIQAATKSQPELFVYYCLMGVSRIASHCDHCLKMVQAADLLEIVSLKMHSGAIHTKDQCDAAHSCCIDILHKADASMQWETARLLIFAIMKAIRRFRIDGEFYQRSLNALIWITHGKNNLMQYEKLAAQFDEMLNDTGLISIAMEAIATGVPNLVSHALTIIVNCLGIVHNEDCYPLRGYLIAYDGFMKIINECLDSSWGEVRIGAAFVLRNLMKNAPSDVIDWFSKEVETIAQLMCLMHHHDLKLQGRVCQMFLFVFLAIANISTADSYSSLKLFVENGVRTIVNSATKSGADIRLVNMIREVLPKQLLTHQKFCSKAQSYIKVSKAIIPRNEGIANTLKSYTNAIFRGTNQTHAGPDPTGGAATVPENSSSLAK